MRERKDAIAYCLTLKGAYEDYPFHDPNWCVIRHRDNKKVFAWIFHKDGHVWINLKCDPQWRDFWRQIYEAVIPAYHLNKEHWNSVILDGSVPEEDIKRMVGESYDLTAPRRAKKRSGSMKANGKAVDGAKKDKNEVKKHESNREGG